MRPLGSKNLVWLSTVPAAAELGISPRQLRSLRADLRFGTHYRSVGRASASRQTYQWNTAAITDYLGLSPEHRPRRSGARRPPAAESR